jgi:cell division protein ZapA (FtsZ GTPase activity inhibitor)
VSVAKGSVAVQIAGQEYRIRSDADAADLQRAASAVDHTMSRIRERTGAVDSLDVAVLAALNLARELIGLREPQKGGTASALAPSQRERIRELIDLAEAALEDS